MPEDIEQLEAKYVAAWNRLRLRQPRISLTIHIDTLISVVSQLQLAQRHPQNKGVSAQQARFFIDQIIALLEPDEPDITHVMRMGNDPKHDVERKLS